MDVARVDVRERDGENAEGLTIAELVLQDGLDELLTGRQGFSACRHHRVDLGDGELVVAVRRDRGGRGWGSRTHRTPRPQGPTNPPTPKSSRPPRPVPPGPTPRKAGRGRRGGP